MHLAQIVPPEEEPVKRIQRTLSSAELKSLVANIVNVLGPPGPERFYVVHLAIGIYNFGTIPYELNGQTIFFIDPPYGLYAQFELPTFLDAPSSKISISFPYHTGAPLAPQINQPLQLGLLGPNELTLGDGTLKIVIFYTIEDLV